MFNSFFGYLLAQAANQGATAQEPSTETNPAANEIELLTDTSNWQAWLDSIYELITTRGTEFGLNLLGAVFIFVVGRWIARILAAVVRRIATKAKIDETLVRFLCNLCYMAILLFVIMAALNRLGVDTTSFAAVVAAAGLAVGLALQSSLSNFSSGVMLVLFKPFKVGDFVNAGGSAGVVEEIHIFNTYMRTGDNVQIIIPNGSITSGTITNFSAKSTRRIDLVVGCGYSDNLRDVRAFFEELINADERILKDPEPVIAVSELGESSVDFIVRPWVNASDYWAVRWDLTEKIKLGFDDRGFNIPFPSRDVYLVPNDDANTATVS